MLTILRNFLWPSTPPPAVKGIRCPICANKSTILSTTDVVGGVKRTRRCTNPVVKHDFTTMEKVS